MDVANGSQGGVSTNSNNENGSSGNLKTGKVLCYLRKFFNKTTGSLPKDEVAAFCLWSYRKARPKKGGGSAYMVPPDGDSMLNEMRATREDAQVS